MEPKNALTKVKALESMKRDVLQVPASEAFANSQNTQTDQSKIQVMIGLTVPIKSLTTLIRCLDHHKEMVSKWSMRYPDDNEISSSLDNISAMIEFITRFRDSEYAELLDEFIRHYPNGPSL